ncbi:TonB-dependent receptor [Bryobacter aggregatus]|uniref:TonB-dependent receptor n=1 Tax=Bryobacter aggregatus TaxID=360054 RepID=UPI0004E1E6D5|nr:TonB-dependent receptor [Bryobacter aggregatus]
MLFPLCLAIPLQAETFSISGIIRDAHGVVAGAKLSLAGPQTVPSTRTNAAGAYRFDSLQPGKYHLSVTHNGFEPLERELVLSTVSIETDLTLQPRAIATTMEVTDLAGKATASRMEIPDRDLPVQVSSIPRDTIESQGLNDLSTALQNASGVSSRVQYGVYEAYTVRGFSGSSVLMVDGMRMEGNRPNTQLNNVEQVEVLKGPSSVLYGGSALAGAINIVRKKPQAIPAYDLSYRVGRFGLNQVGASATGAILGRTRLLYRLDTMFENSDGWRGAGAKRFNVSPTFTWLLHDRARLTFFQGYTQDRFKLDAGIPNGLYNVPGFDLSSRFNTKQDFEAAREWQNQIFFNGNINSKWEVRNSFFYNRKGDQYYHAESLSYQPALNQVNRTALYFYHHRRPLQNQSDVLGNFQFLGLKHYVLAGYEYQDFYNFTDRSAGRSIALPPVLLPSFSDAYVPVPDFPTTSVDFSSALSRATYWQDQISIGKRLKVNVGGRFTDYNRSAFTNTYTSTGITRGIDSKRHATAYTYRAGLVYSLTEGQQVYFSSNSSFTPVTTIPADGRELLPELGRSFEVGHRWQAFGGRFKANTALYKMVRQNVTVALGAGLYNQAGQQSSKGIDFDATGDLGRGIRLVANYGYTLPRYDEYFTSNGTVDLSGRRPNYTTRHVGNVWLTKQWGSFYTSLGARYMGPVFLNDTNTARLGGWTRLGGAVGYRRKFYDWSLNAENLFNRQRYIVSTLGSNGAQLFPGSPINIFTTIRLRFRS